MSTIQVAKKGGPYPKQQQEERRNKVYKLYFEEAKPVVKIATILGVNRNTINADIKYWYSQLSHQISHETITSSALKQIHNMELQKTRIREQLEGTADFSQRIILERFLFEIEDKLGQHVEKILSNKSKLIISEKIEVEQNEIKSLVQKMVLENNYADEDADVQSENRIKIALIQKTRCEEKYAQAALDEMKRLGLELCEWGIDEDYSNSYDLAQFGLMRGYITDEEYGTLCKKRERIRQEIGRKNDKKLAEE